MTWNHRVMEKDGEYTIREVYCGEDGELEMFTGPIGPYGETLDELKADLVRMMRATLQPILTESDFPKFTAED